MKKFAAKMEDKQYCFLSLSMFNCLGKVFRASDIPIWWERRCFGLLGGVLADLDATLLKQCGCWGLDVAYTQNVLLFVRLYQWMSSHRNSIMNRVDMCSTRTQRK